MIVRKSIYEAIKHLKPKSKEEIQSCLRRLSPDEKLREGIEKRMYWLMKIAVKEGANIHVDDDYPLRVVALDGQVELVKLLLDAGADPYATHKIFPTHDAFYWAEQSNKPEKYEIIELLKQHKKEK